LQYRAEDGAWCNEDILCLQDEYYSNSSLSRSSYRYLAISVYALVNNGSSVKSWRGLPWGLRYWGHSSLVSRPSYFLPAPCRPCKPWAKSASFFICSRWECAWISAL